MPFYTPLQKSDWQLLSPSDKYILQQTKKVMKNTVSLQVGSIIIMNASGRTTAPTSFSLKLIVTHIKKGAAGNPLAIQVSWRPSGKDGENGVIKPDADSVSNGAQRYPLRAYIAVSHYTQKTDVSFIPSSKNLPNNIQMVEDYSLDPVTKTGTIILHQEPRVLTL